MYQERDYEVIDYDLFLLPGTDHHIRGPAPQKLAPDEYFTAVGAAQTFGCFCDKPYPTLLSEQLGLPALNLGYAGAGPRFFLQHDVLLQYVNEGRFAIVQVMSGRSEDNSLFETGGREYLTRRSDGQRIGAEPAYRELLATGSPELIETVVQETRRNWVESFSALLERIQVPTILFWFSTRSPAYDENRTDVHGLFGEFPHLINGGMIDEISHLSDEYVECTSTRGLPQRLYSRFTGEPVSVNRRADLGGNAVEFNHYYPAPEMHADAAEALIGACRAHIDYVH